MKKPSASILIVTLFLLIITGLIGVIVMAYIRSMLAFTNRFHDYQKAFYLANAGLELQLVKAKYHGFGYEDELGSGSKTVTENIACASAKCVFSCDLKTKSYVTSQTEQVTSNTISCVDLGYYTDTTKLISSLYLFEDAANKSNQQEWTLVSDKELIKIANTNIVIRIEGISSYRLALQASNPEGEASDFDKIVDLNATTVDLLDYQADFFTQIPDDHQVKVKIINDLKQDGTVCFEVKPWGERVPWFHQVVTSIGYFNNTVVRLQAIQTNIPWDEQDLAGWNI